MQKRWKFFLKNIKEDTLEFTVVINEIHKFLESVFEAIVNEYGWLNSWVSQSNLWRNINYQICKS